jgi:hypothetical protein
VQRSAGYVYFPILYEIPIVKNRADCLASKLDDGNILQENGDASSLEIGNF